jgi:hypothetical protein
MPTERDLLWQIVGATVSGAALVTGALLPATANGGTAEDQLLLTLPAVVGLAGFLGWIVIKAASPSPKWIIPLAVVAAWGVVVGALVVFSNWSAWNFYADDLQLQIEQTERIRQGNSGDMDPDPPGTPEQIAESRAEEEESREMVSLSKRSVLWGGVLVLIGLASGMMAARLRHKGRTMAAG